MYIYIHVYTLHGRLHRMGRRGVGAAQQRATRCCEEAHSNQRNCSLLVADVIGLHAPKLRHIQPLLKYGQSLYEDSGFQRVWLKHSFDFKGLNYHVHTEFQGSFESTNLSRDNLSSEIGSKQVSADREEVHRPVEPPDGGQVHDLGAKQRRALNNQFCAFPSLPRTKHGRSSHIP